MKLEEKGKRRLSHRVLCCSYPYSFFRSWVSLDTAPAGVKPADIGSILPLWSVLPFVGILLSIALFPLFAPRFWHHHFPKVSAFWALVLAIPFLIAYKDTALYEIAHIYIIDYVPFIILLWSLFVVSGGIYVKGSLKGTPAVNVTLLLIGTVLASLIGTTGASMLLIRPVLRSNSWRRHKVHTMVFFIFLISNIGGALTPLGDPPLFLGFLHGVPFFWTFKITAAYGVRRERSSLPCILFWIHSITVRKTKRSCRPPKGSRWKSRGPIISSFSRESSAAFSSADW